MDIRDNIVSYIKNITNRTNFTKIELIKMMGISKSRYYQWEKRFAKPNNHNGKIPKKHWILESEKKAILGFCKSRKEQGYRRLTYMMLDADIVAVCPSTTYRILKENGYFKRWNNPNDNKNKGFSQPEKVHDHWHMDISYVNIVGTIFFLITVLDGASRYVVHHELRTNMTGYDTEITLQKAKEKFPNAKPRIISDNGSQFISKDFKDFIRLSGFTHVRTSPYHPQSNGKIERFHKTIKSEEIRINPYLSIEDARNHIDNFIKHYNSVRLHSAIKYLTPETILMGKKEQLLNERKIKLNKAKLIRYSAEQKLKAA